jgi:hypothetical protein
MQKKLWTSHERQVAQARAFQNNKEYILPFRFDNTDIPGLNETIAYLSVQDYTPGKLAEVICEKLVNEGIGLRPKALVQSTGESLPPREETSVTIRVLDPEGKAVRGASIYLMAPNGTYLAAASSAEGIAQLNVLVRRQSTLFCAHPDYRAYKSEPIDSHQDFVVRI